MIFLAAFSDPSALLSPCCSCAVLLLLALFATRPPPEAFCHSRGLRIFLAGLVFTEDLATTLAAAFRSFYLFSQGLVFEEPFLLFLLSPFLDPPYLVLPRPLYPPPPEHLPHSGLPDPLAHAGEVDLDLFGS